MDKLLLVDANSLMHRAYHGYPQLTTAKGELIGAVYGFTAMLLSTIEKVSPKYIAVAWDVGKVTFRHKDFAEYKAGRAKTDQELIDQFDRTKEVVEVLNIPQFGVVDFEADDIIGTVATKAEGERSEVQVVILTGDRDALQLVKEDRIVVYMPSVGGFSKDRGISIYDEEAVMAKYNLSPSQIVDLKSLMGDASDNIPGVRGIGQVTATKILNQYPTTEIVYENIDTLNQTERIKKLLIDGKEKALLSKKLATINREVPVDFSWDKCELADYDREKTLSLFGDLGFKSLVNKLPRDRWEEDLDKVFV